MLTSHLMHHFGDKSFEAFDWAVVSANSFSPSVFQNMYFE